MVHAAERPSTTESYSKCFDASKQTISTLHPISVNIWLSCRHPRDPLHRQTEATRARKAYRYRHDSVPRWPSIIPNILLTPDSRVRESRPSQLLCGSRKSSRVSSVEWCRQIARRAHYMTGSCRGNSRLRSRCHKIGVVIIPKFPYCSDCIQFEQLHYYLQVRYRRYNKGLPSFHDHCTSRKNDVRMPSHLRGTEGVP